MSRADLRRAAALALTAALTLSGCTDTEVGPDASPEPATSPNRWKPGEFTHDLNVCGAVGKATKDRLGVDELSADVPGTRPTDCHWGHQNGRGYHTILLSVRQLRYEPPPPRPTHTASQEAQHEFQRPQGWHFGTSAVPVKGFGDQAKIAREWVPGYARREVSAVVRLRNVLFIVEAESGTAVGDSLSDLGEEDTRIASFARLEEGVYAATREVVAKAGGRVPARPRNQPPGPSEVVEVDDVCGTESVTSRMVESLEPRNLDQIDEDHAQGCRWTGEDLAPELVIEAEAVASSPFTGEPGQDVAESIRFEGDPLAESIPEDHYGIGLGSVFAYDEFDDGKNHEVEVTARRGNLLLHVAYERWFDPPQPKRPAWMKADVADVAEEITRAN